MRFESGDELPDSIRALISPRDPPSREHCGRTPSAEMLEAFEQFNRGEYWEQHETLEAVWRAEQDPGIRNFYKGIIQVGVGLHHLRRNNYPGVMKVLARGITYLEPYAPDCFGVDVARLIRESSRVYHLARERGSSGLGMFEKEALPRIHFIG